MMRASRWRVLPLASLLLAVLLAGCGGPKMVKVKGKVTQGGQLLQVSQKTYVTITFAPVEVAEGQGQTYPARFTHADGTFAVTVPAGKYRVGMLIVEPGGQPLSSPVEASKPYEIFKDQVIDLELNR